MGDRKTFVFNTDWREVLRDYPAEVRLEVYEAVIDYAISGTYSELKPLSKLAFSFIKRELDYNTEKYNEVVAKRREAGLMGAAAKQANQANAKSAKQNKQMEANAKSAKQAQANQADIVNDIDNDIMLDKSNNARTRVRDGLKFVSEEYLEAFTRWVNYKAERKEKYKTKESLQECYERLKVLSGNNPTTAMAIVKQSIANNWAGLFELKQSKNGNSSQQDRKHFATSETGSYKQKADIEI